MTMADFDDVIDVNLRGTMRVVQPAYKAMQAGGGGRIVTITSSSGMLGAHFQANYATSKAAMVGFTRAIALEGAAHGIKANAVAPGALGTRMHLAMVEAGRSERRGRAPTSCRTRRPRELMKPERVSPLITVLTHASCPVTGEILCSWGGYYGRFGITTNRGWAERRRGGHRRAARRALGRGHGRIVRSGLAARQLRRRGEGRQQGRRRSS